MQNNPNESTQPDLVPPQQGSVPGNPQQGPFPGNPQQGPFPGNPQQGPFPGNPQQGPFPGNSSPGSFPGNPYPTPPVRKKSNAGLIIGIVIAVVVLCIAGSGLGVFFYSTTLNPQNLNTNTTKSTPQNQTKEATTQGQNTTPTSTAATPTTAPVTNDGAHGKVGDELVVNESWTAKVLDVKTAAGNTFSKPKDGFTYLVVHVSVKNTSSEVKPMSSLLSWKLQDKDGEGYNQVLTYADPGRSPDGTVAANSPLAGYLVYEVATSKKDFTLQFTPELGKTDLRIWDISY